MLIICNSPFSLLYGKERNKKKMTSEKKEPLVFHGQLN